MREQALTRPSIAPPASFGTSPLGILRRKCACEGSAIPCTECGADEQQAPLRRRAASNDGPGAAPPIVHDVLRSPGRPLDGETRRYFEPRFGHDFSKVRVHTDQQAAASARSVNAVAYAVGNDIAFESGRYRPGTITGRRLLAHELAHVIQQSGTPRATTLRIGSAADASEKEAESVAARVTEGRAPVPVQRASGSLQRQANDSDPVSNADPPGASLAGSPQPSQTGSGSDASVKAPASPEKPEHCPPPANLGCEVGTAPAGGTATTVSFAVNSSALSASQRRQMDAAAATWNSSGATGSVQVDGYASAEYECGYNWQLSCRRAQAVAAELQSPSDGSKGVPAANISVVAHGESDAAGTALAPNRRVAVSIPATPPNPNPKPAPNVEPPTGRCGPGTSNPFCLPGFGDSDTPCVPFESLGKALGEKAALSVEVPGPMAVTTRCMEVKAVWDAYFANKPARFAFSDRSSCVVAAAKTNANAVPIANGSADDLLKDIVDNLPVTLRGATPSPFPLGGSAAVVRLPLDEAIDGSKKGELHPKIIYGDAPTNAAGNLAGGISGSKFGTDDRVMGGNVVIDVKSIDPASGMMSGQVRWQPRVHVIDTVDFCPGGLGGWVAQLVTVRMSKLEVMGLVEPIPITIDYDLDLRETSFSNVSPLVGPIPIKAGSL
jgi:outer membrane protein OmpA-like peptidoglycan-associated protein